MTRTHSSLALLLLGSGCLAPLSGSLRLRDQPLELRAVPEAARLVFIRPGRFQGSAVGAIFIEERTQRVLGKSVDHTAFAVDVAPGTYTVCPVATFEQANTHFRPDASAHLTTVIPPTQLTVEAGRTYLLEVSIGWGPRVEAVPVKPGTNEERALLKSLSAVRPVDVSPEAIEVPPADVAPWLVRCRESHNAEVRLTAGPQDGRLTAPPSPL